MRYKCLCRHRHPRCVAVDELAESLTWSTWCARARGSATCVNVPPVRVGQGKCCLVCWRLAAPQKWKNILRVHARRQKLCPEVLCCSCPSLPKMDQSGEEEAEVSQPCAGLSVRYLLWFCLCCFIFLLNTAFGTGETGEPRMGRGEGQAAQPAMSKELL